MNILPKKSWHVRNKDNIERVRRDEEKAAEEEKARQKRVALAESEARTELLRQKARYRDDSDSSQIHSSSSQKHINFFEDIEHGRKLDKKNAEHEEEKRIEKEKQEKAIGLLTYLGQGSVELEANKPWYFSPREKQKHSSDEASKHSKHKDEFDAKRKRAADPMQMMASYIDQSKKVHKLQQASDSHSTISHHRHRNEGGKKSRTKSLAELRAERLRREQTERKRTDELLAKMRGEAPSAAVQPIEDDRQRRYNSQFNPDIARRPRPHNDFS